MTEPTRFSLHTERASEVHKWTDIGWTDCGEHPSEPGYRTLEWRRGGAICVPVCAVPTSGEVDAVFTKIVRNTYAVTPPVGSDAPPRAASVRLGPESFTPAIPDTETAAIARTAAALGEERG